MRDIPNKRKGAFTLETGYLLVLGPGGWVMGSRKSFPLGWLRSVRKQEKNRKGVFTLDIRVFTFETSFFL